MGVEKVRPLDALTTEKKPATEQRTVYADNAATTPLSAHALEAMTPYLTEVYGNASGFYRAARDAKRALEAAREQVAAALGAEPSEIYFTSGGTEGDNWAIKGTLELRAKKGRHIITSAIEHHAILYTLQHLEKQGYEVTYLPVNEFGQISLDELRAAIRPDTVLITIMAANNEIGTILPVAEIAEIAHEHDVLFHTDAVQAVAHIPVDVKAWGVDMLSLSAHKFHGPKGVGALYIRRGLKLPALLVGGGHERGGRSGTENVAGVVGLATALADAVDHMTETGARVKTLRDRLIREVLESIPYSRLTGDPIDRLPGTASFIFECIEGESMVLMLDRRGIAASSGSACSSGSLDPSHVLLAIGLPHELAHGSLRLSLSDTTTEEDVDYILEQLPPIIARLRSMSPLWDEKFSGKNTKAEEPLKEAVR